MGSAHLVNVFFGLFGLDVASPLGVCVKLVVTFIFLILVRVTVPKYKLETITKLGWLHVFSWLLLIFLTSILVLSFFR